MGSGVIVQPYNKPGQSNTVAADQTRAGLLERSWWCPKLPQGLDLTLTSANHVHGRLSAAPTFGRKRTEMLSRPRSLWVMLSLDIKAEE